MIQYAVIWCGYDFFFCYRRRLLANKLMIRQFQPSTLTSIFQKSHSTCKGVIWKYHLHLGEMLFLFFVFFCTLVCFMPIVISCLYVDFDYGSLRLTEHDRWLTTGMTGQYVMFPPPGYLIPHGCVQGYSLICCKMCILQDRTVGGSSVVERSLLKREVVLCSRRT